MDRRKYGLITGISFDLALMRRMDRLKKDIAWSEHPEVKGQESAIDTQAYFDKKELKALESCQKKLRTIMKQKHKALEKVI